MQKPRIPTLINGSLGRPQLATAGKKCVCSLCRSDIHKGDKCYDVPNPRAAFSAKRRFCISCFKEIVLKTETDLAGIKAEAGAA
jgi:hypothetical protein